MFPILLAQAATAPKKLEGETSVNVSDIQDGGMVFPEAASTVAGTVDGVFWAIFWVCVFFFVVIVAAMVYFMVKYKGKPGDMPEESPHHNTPLEVAWSVGPSVLLVFMFLFGFYGYMDMRTPPEEAYEVQVVAKKWFWNFTYPSTEGGTFDHPELHVPPSEPVKLNMQSDDVLHSFFVPAFRVKMDVVPGRYTKTWFNAEVPGTYSLFCTEYCGRSHSSMISKVVVHESQEDFNKWVEKESAWREGKEPAEIGRILWEQKKGCIGCHSIDGSANPATGGPSFKGIWGTEVQTDKGTVKVDEEYIRESVLNPQAKIHAGYKGIMPTYAGQLTEEDINGIIAFIKSLKD